MDEQLLKRYYQGETSIREERELKKMYQQGLLSKHPSLGYTGENPDFPEILTERIRNGIHQRQRRRTLQWLIAAGSMAAIFILIISLQGLFSEKQYPNIQLSNNLKKERFENALRVISDAIENRTANTEEILYEDNKIIISIE